MNEQLILRDVSLTNTVWGHRSFGFEQCERRCLLSLFQRHQARNNAMLRKNRQRIKIQLDQNRMIIQRFTLR